MSDNYQKVYGFFSDLGLSIQECQRFESFGNYIIEECSKHFCVQGSRDRGFESIEFRSVSDPDNWFAANVVMSLVLREDLIMPESTLETEMKFLESHLDELAIVFDKENYTETKTALKEMELQRGRILWPRWFP